MSLPACIKLPSGFFADPLVFVKRVNIDRTKVAKDELEPETLRKALMDIWLRSLVDKDEGQQRVKRYEEGQQRVKKNAAAIIPQCQRLCYDYQDALAAKAAAKAAALLEAKNTLTVAVDQSTATAAASGAGLLSVGDPTIVCTGAHPASNLPQNGEAAALRREKQLVGENQELARVNERLRTLLEESAREKQELVVSCEEALCVAAAVKARAMLAAAMYWPAFTDMSFRDREGKLRALYQRLLETLHERPSAETPVDLSRLDDESWQLLKYVVQAGGLPYRIDEGDSRIWSRSVKRRSRSPHSRDGSRDRRRRRSSSGKLSRNEDPRSRGRERSRFVRRR